MRYNLFEATLNGVAFSSLSDELILLDIVEEASQMNTQTTPRTMGDGMIRTLNRRESLSVRLEYQIRTQDTIKRAAVRDAVTSWAAKGGNLKVNTRPDLQLSVVMDAAPALESSMKWDAPLSVVFTAYAVPYWEGGNSSVNVEMFYSAPEEYYMAGLIEPAGNIAVPLRMLLFVSENSFLHQFSITCGETSMTFEGMEIEPGSIIAVDYDQNGILYAENMTDLEGENSLLGFRTPDSNDNLIAEANVSNQIIVVADAELTGRIYTRGRWL